MTSKDLKPKKKQPEGKSDGMRWAGMGVQMVIYIGIFVFAGVKLDQWMHTSKPWFTLGLSVTGVVFTMVYMIRSFLRDN